MKVGIFRPPYSPVSEKRETDRQRQDLERGVGEEEREKEGSLLELFFGGQSIKPKMFSDCGLRNEDHGGDKRGNLPPCRSSIRPRKDYEQRQEELQ